MTLMPLAPSPGVCFSATDYAVGKDSSFVASGSGAYRQGAGRWANATNVEFIAGFPQKIAGWSAAVLFPMEGVPRCNKNWRGNDGLAREAIGTTTHLYAWLSGTATDITPLQVISSGTLGSTPLTTVNQSTTVAVADNSQTLQNGDWVMLSASAAVGGLTIDGWYQVQARTGSGYNITSLVAATSGTSGGGTVTFQYPRKTLTNPFTTTNASATVNVTHTAHNQVAGNFVVFNGASAVGGLVVNGEYQIASVVDADNYTITAASAATSGAGPGGGSVNVIYLIAVHQVTNSALPVWGQTGVVWGGAGMAWGTSNVQVATLPDGWTLDAYGSQMLACPVGGTIYVYDPAAAGRAYPLLNAPTNVQAMFVTPERFVVALGTSSSALQLAWADQNDYTQWVTTSTNTANTGRNLIGGSYFVGGVAVRNGVCLLFTDRCVFEMSYAGGQEIYNTPLIGDNCGLVGPWAVCVEGGVVYWMSDQDWWSWNGGVAGLPSDDVRASVFQATGSQLGLNRQQMAKSIAVLNRAKRQVRFFMPSASASENDNGMIYQYDQQCFSPLGFGRSAGVDANLLQTPMSCDQFGILYYDETGTDANGAPLPWMIEVADMDISNGDKNVDILGFLPNFETLSGDTQFIAQAAYYPADVFQTDGPWPMTNTTQRQDLRLDGKLFAFSLSGSGLGATMRLGISRLDVQSSGARR